MMHEFNIVVCSAEVPYCKFPLSAHPVQPNGPLGMRQGSVPPGIG